MKISVCLITYNGSFYINEQIDSILEQTIHVNEIIVSNDASTDNTLSILQTYSLRYPELFKIINNTSTLGAVQNIEHCIVILILLIVLIVPNITLKFIINIEFKYSMEPDSNQN